MKVVGISDAHNASAMLLVDGAIQGALQEERLSRVKSQAGIPRRAIRSLLERAQLRIEDVDVFAVSSHHNPISAATTSEMLASYKATDSVPYRLRRKVRNIPGVYSYYSSLRKSARVKDLGAIGIPEAKIRFVDHHLCHASAAYYGWGAFDGPVLVLTCDGAGDGLCGTVSIGRGGRLERLAAIEEQHSIGNPWTMVTFLLGMVPLEHEYKIMGLAPYAKDSKDVRRVREKFKDLFEMPPSRPLEWSRRTSEDIYRYGFWKSIFERERFDWIAAGLQRATEEILVRWVQNCIRETGVRKVALSGGVFMNVKANKALLEIPELEELFIFPSCGDETNSFGAAFETYVRTRRQNPSLPPLAPLGPFYFGFEVSRESALEAVEASAMFKAGALVVEECDDVEPRLAQLLAENQVVARMKGPMEFGARALGNRSILASAARPELVKRINEMIKNRDFWMPFAPSVLASRTEDYYIKPKAMPSPYMMMTFDGRPDRGDRIAAAAHPYDGSTRPQEVDQSWNPDYHRLLSEYEKLTGDGIILNTSFNLHGEPIACTPEDALHVFEASSLTHLAIGDVLISKRSI